MVKILNWNARGLGMFVKRRYLRDILRDNHIDMVCIQETKKESFHVRTLRALSTFINQWEFKPSIGASGGLLFGYNDSLFFLIASHIRQYSITLHIKNKIDNFEWCFTTVYGPLTSVDRRDFLLELQDIGNMGISAWLIMGDFNMIRRRSERTGLIFSHIICSRFNSFIRNNQLMEMSLPDRKFTWARSLNSPSQALLDRVLCSTTWNAHYNFSTLSSLPRTYSDHNPIILDTQAIVLPHSKLIRFDKSWLEFEGFFELLSSWWISFPLTNDLGLSWKLKMQFLRTKLRGWSSNVRGEKKES